MARGDTAVIKVVLVEGAAGDWAAYAAPASQSDEEAKSSGNKLLEQVARQVAYFGGFDEWTTKPYRD